jgi:hypothetical protein
MVQVVYAPWKEIVIHEAMKHLLQDLVNLQTLGVQPGGLGNPLLWAEGVAFVHQGMPPTDDIIKEQMQGRVHWSNVRFAVMPEYQDAIVIKETNMKIPVINVENNPILRAGATWLKEHAEEL